MLIVFWIKYSYSHNYIILIISDYHKEAYRRQRKICIATVLAYEMKCTELIHFKDKYEYHKVQELSIEVEKLKEDMEVLFSKQVDLFFKIEMKNGKRSSNTIL